MAVLVVNRGTTFNITVRYSHNGVPASLVGATVRFTMKNVEYSPDMADADAILKLDVTNGTADGVAVITLAPADTAGLTPGEFFYDIKVEEVGGDVFKIIEGRLRLDASPTNRRG